MNEQAYSQRNEVVKDLCEWFRGESKRSDFPTKLFAMGEIGDKEWMLRKGVSTSHPYKKGWLRGYAMVVSFVYEDTPIMVVEEEIDE